MNAPATSPVMNGYKTISTLHWRAISFGYMKPSTPLIVPRLSSPVPGSLANRTVQFVVESLRAGGHLRLKHLHAMSLQEFMDWIIRILQVNKLTCARRAVFAAGGRQALRNPVVAERALVGHLLLRMNVTATIRASLHAICATQAVLLIDQHHSVGRHKRRADRTQLCAWRIGTVVAHLRNEEILARIFLRNRESVLAAIRRNHLGADHVLVRNVVALYPRAEMPFRHIVLRFTSPYAVSAANALGNINQHAPPVL